MWPILFAHTMAARCVDAARPGMLRAGESVTMAVNKEKNAPAPAPAFTMAPAIASTVATFRNICGPYHGTGPVVNPARYIAQHLSPYHTGARLSGRRYIPKCLHLARNGKRYKHPATVSDIRRGAQLVSQTPARGRRYKHPATSKGKELAANQFFIINSNKRQLIVNCYSPQSAINFLFFNASKCYQFFIIINEKVQLILYSLHRKVQLINNKNKQLKSNNNKQ